MDNVSNPTAKTPAKKPKKKGGDVGRPPMHGRAMGAMLRVRFPEEVYEQLKAYSEEHEEAMSEIIREALVETGVVRRSA